MAYICSVECSVCSSVGLLLVLPSVDDVHVSAVEGNVKEEGEHRAEKEERLTM